MKRLVVRLLTLLLVTLPAAALASTGCTLGPGPAISFGQVVALASTGDVDSNSGSSLVVRCGADVSLPPSLYSSSDRVLSGPGATLPLRLSLVAPGGLELADAAPGTPLSIPGDEADHVVTVFARLQSLDFAALPSGHYSGSVTLTLQY